MISPNQLLCLLLLSRFSAEIVFPHGGGFDASSLAALAAAELLRFLAALPVIVYSMNKTSVYGAISQKNRALGIIAGYISAFAVMFLATRSVLFTAEYAQRFLAAGMSGAVLAVLLGIFAVYAAVKGIEAIGRTGLLLAAAAVIISVAVVLADIPHMELRHINGAQYDESFIRQAADYALRGGEYFIFAALLPYISKSKRGMGACGASLIFALCSISGTLLIKLFSMLVLGEVYAITEYPFTAAAGLSDITLFKRLDGFMAAIWATCAGLRSALLLFSGYAMISTVLKPSRGKAALKGEAS